MALPRGQAIIRRRSLPMIARQTRITCKLHPTTGYVRAASLNDQVRFHAGTVLSSADIISVFRPGFSPHQVTPFKNRCFEPLNLSRFEGCRFIWRCGRVDAVSERHSRLPATPMIRTLPTGRCWRCGGARRCRRSTAHAWPLNDEREDADITVRVSRRASPGARYPPTRPPINFADSRPLPGLLVRGLPVLPRMSFFDTGQPPG